METWIRAFAGMTEERGLSRAEAWVGQTPSPQPSPSGEGAGLMPDGGAWIPAVAGMTDWGARMTEVLTRLRTVLARVTEVFARMTEAPAGATSVHDL